MNLGDLVRGIREYLPNLEERDAVLLQNAYEYAEEKHRGQERRSKCPYFVHPCEVAKILIGLRMDPPTICAGLLHDVLEDTDATRSEMAKRFGNEITELVEGVTKLGALPSLRFEERQAENYRKMVFAMARDIRVVIIKLADRLHNMETIQYMPEAKQRRIAKETIEIYAPLAARLGIHRIRTELEDLAFKTLEPEKYREIASWVAEKRTERETYATEMAREIRRALEIGGIKDVEVFGRPKHLYSIHQKITLRGVPFDQIHDLIAFRILVNTVDECYLAMCYLHGRWMPKPERFKDYIATPKMNLYQSLHTTIMDYGRSVEVQIRTHDMHRVCELGIAAHWAYKEAGRSVAATDHNDAVDRFAWFRQLLEQIRDVRNPSEFMQAMEGELFDEEIYVFTPKGDLKTFCKGATPIDFAFAIHTEVGLHTTGAKVNGRIVPLRSELNSGDSVEVITDPDAKPSKDWLRFVKTSRARNKVKHWWREQEYEQNVEIGRQLIETELRKRKLTSKGLLTPKTLVALAEEFKVASPDAFLAEVGSRQISAQRVYHILAPPEDTEDDEPPAKPQPAQMVDARLDGIEHTVTKIAKCCAPVPGDDVVGFVTRGRGVTIHMRDCPRIAGEFERVTPIEWYASGNTTYQTEIVVESNDRKGLLRDVTDAIAELGVNIHAGDVRTPDTFTAMHVWSIHVHDLKQLDAVQTAIQRVKGVRRVSRRRKG